jgi:YfiH family protein
MMIHETPDFRIYFGTQEQAYVPFEHIGFLAHEREPFRSLVGMDQLIFLHQVHGAYGRVVREQDVKDPIPAFVNDGDYLLTNVPHIGLGISTADCLPIVFVDTKLKAVGIAHAGWRGSFAGIAIETLEHMKAVYGTVPADVEIFFGPGAHWCCYEVQPPFQAQFSRWPGSEKAFVKRGEKLFFDGPRFNEMVLSTLGVAQIHQDYAQCTICTPGHCSVRKPPVSPERQFTVVALR